jgi:hypothetical protein
MKGFSASQFEQLDKKCLGFGLWSILQKEETTIKNKIERLFRNAKITIF